ncbi:MAG TPA: c-type cytochrome [Pseudomonadales bacterium]|nr:c-type cytochrome [Pseudomonadales bacterium]
MLRTLKALVLVASSITGSLALASDAPPAASMAGDPAAGASKAIVCSACHGQEGQAILPAYPNLGGQHYSYLLDQMKKFRSGERYAVLMAGQVDNLGDEDLADIAAYYAAKPKVVGEADGALELGARIYQAGLDDKGVPACIACHSPRGLGNGPAKFPMLSGQHSEYVALQLKAYRDGERKTDESVGQMMRGVAANLNDREIEAVSAYVRGLH